MLFIDWKFYPSRLILMRFGSGQKIESKMRGLFTGGRLLSFMSNEQVNLLKIVKIPIWARWLGWYRARQRRKNAHKEIHFIGTVYAWTYWSDLKTYAYQWYICRENGVGQRSYEYGTHCSWLKNNEKNNSVYASVIAPWMLGGRSNQSLQSYAAQSHKQPNRVE